MKKRKIFLKALLSLAIIILSGFAAKPVHAYINFRYDSITMSVGDNLYLPYMMDTNEYIVECVSEDQNNSNPVVTLYRSISGSDGYGYEITGKRPGTTTVYAISEDENYGAITIHVQATPTIQKNTPIQIFYPAGHASKMYKLYVDTTGVYRFQHAGPSESEIIIYDESGNLVVETDYEFQNGTNKLDIMLNGGTTYYVTARTYTYHILHSEEEDQTYQFAWGTLAVPSKVSMNLDTEKILTSKGNTYYILEDEYVPTRIVSHSNSFLTEDIYSVSSSNPNVAKLEQNWTKNYTIDTGVAGDAILEAKTASGVTGKIHIKVVKEKDIVPGDMDMDGVISRKDLLAIYHTMVKKIPVTNIYWYSDANSDGMVNFDDIPAFQKIIGGLPFADVDPKDWYYQSVNYCYESNIMSGMNTVEFAPADPVTRAQLPAILYRLEGSADVEYESLFSDVEKDMWYTSGILWANDNHIVYGYADSNKFGILDKISREQIAVMLYRYAGYKEYDRSKTADYTEFADSDSVSSYANEAMKWAVGNKFIVGNSDGTLNPLGMATRAEVASIIQRFLNVYAPAE